MYPLQLLTGDVLLAVLMGMTTMAQLQAMEGITATPKATPEPETPAAPLDGKCWWQSSKQSHSHPQIPPAEEEEASKEHHYKRFRPLKEDRHEAFSKEYSPVRAARQTYQDSHPIKFQQEGSHDLSLMSATKWHLLPAS